MEDKFKKHWITMSYWLKFCRHSRMLIYPIKDVFHFFEMLKEKQFTLLIHTRLNIHLKLKQRHLNDPKKLKNAALGVKSFVLHCGTKLHFYEKCYFEDWKNLARNTKMFTGTL